MHFKLTYTASEGASIGASLQSGMEAIVYTDVYTDCRCSLVTALSFSLQTHHDHLAPKDVNFVYAASKSR